MGGARGAGSHAPSSTAGPPVPYELSREAAKRDCCFSARPAGAPRTPAAAPACPYTQQTVSPGRARTACRTGWPQRRNRPDAPHRIRHIFVTIISIEARASRRPTHLRSRRNVYPPTRNGISPTSAFTICTLPKGTSPLATRRNSRGKSVLAHRWLATAGLGIALGRRCTCWMGATRKLKAMPRRRAALMADQVAWNSPGFAES